MRVDGDRVVVYDAREELAAGWYDVTLDLVAGACLTEPVLSVTLAGGEEDEVEYPLAPLAGGRTRTLIRLGSGARRIELFDHGGGDAGASVEAAELARVRWMELIRRAVERSPEDVRRALVWRARGKKLRALNILKRILPVPEPVAYRPWLARREEGWSREIRELRSALGPTAAAADVAVVVLTSDSAGPCVRTLHSINSAAGGESQVIVAREGAWDGVAEALEQSMATWVLLLRDGDVLADGAHLRILEHARSNPDVSAIYGDHDHLDRNARRRAPHFKPQWNEQLFWSRDYIGAIAVRRDAMRAAGGLACSCMDLALDDLVLRMCAAGGVIAHLPRILHHASLRPLSRNSAVAQRRAELVGEYLARRSCAAEADAGLLGQVRITLALPDAPPLVSLIVPTRDRVDLLRPCVEGLLHGTDYPALEIIIADNSSSEHATLDYLARIATDRRVRILPMPGDFNFAAINNEAARVAKGRVIGFINNDVEVIEPGWLKEMVSWALRPDVGAVGAKLLYATGYVQHAGVILGIRGIAGHAHRFYPAAHAGYMGRLQAVQRLSAVTAACLVVERSKFDRIGGFDAAAFPVALNDVDLCLRLDRLGLASIYTPYAELLHKESASRAHDLSPARREAYDAEVAAFRNRWAEQIAADPCYHPHLTRENESFALL